MGSERKFINCMLEKYERSSGLWEGYHDHAWECRIDEELGIRTSEDQTYVVNTAMQDGVITAEESESLSFFLPSSVVQGLAGDDGMNAARARSARYQGQWSGASRHDKKIMTIGWFELGEPAFSKLSMPLMLRFFKQTIAEYHRNHKLRNHLPTVGEFLLTQQMPVENRPDYPYFGIDAMMTDMLWRISLLDAPPREFLPFVREAKAIPEKNPSLDILVSAILFKYGEADALTFLKKTLEGYEFCPHEEDRQLALLLLARHDSPEGLKAAARPLLERCGHSADMALLLTFLKTSRFEDDVVQLLSDPKVAASLEATFDTNVQNNRYCRMGVSDLRKEVQEEALYSGSEDSAVSMMDFGLIERVMVQLPTAALEKIVRAEASDRICMLAVEEAKTRVDTDKGAYDLLKEARAKLYLPLTAEAAESALKTINKNDPSRVDEKAEALRLRVKARWNQIRNQ